MATAESAAKADSATHADVLIIGAGISGIGSACHLQAAEPHGRTGRDAAQSRSGVTIRITGQRGRRFLPLISRVVSSFMTATGGVNRAPLTAVPGIVWINAHERLHSRESGDRTATTGDGSSTPPTTDKASERTAAAKTTAEKSPANADDAQASSQGAGDNGSMPKLSEDDPQAKNLAYVHNADDVIASEQPRYEQGQACSNCQLYQGTANDEWAGCPLFAGKRVKGTGWCNAYAPQSG